MTAPTPALVVTHGELGRHLIATAETVVGVRSQLTALSNDGHSADSLREQIGRWLDAHAGAVLVLVDEASGSCGIAAAAACVGRDHTWIIGGVNIPMLVAYLGGAGVLPPEQLAEKVLERGRAAVRIVGAQA